MPTVFTSVFHKPVIKPYDSRLSETGGLQSYAVILNSVNVYKRPAIKINKTYVNARCFGLIKCQLKRPGCRIGISYNGKMGGRKAFSIIYCIKQFDFMSAPGILKFPVIWICFKQCSCIIT